MKKIIYSANYLLKKSMIQLLVFYKVGISPYISSQCSYAITCSQYSKIKISEKGIFLGIILSAIRVLSCTLNPLKNALQKFRFKTKLFFLPLFLVLFISCMNFSYQGGWSNILYDPSEDIYFVTTNEGKLYNFGLKDSLPVINWSYPDETKNTSYTNPIIFEDSIISSNFNCKGKSCDSEVFQLNKFTGELEWIKRIPSKISPKIEIYNNILMVSTLKIQDDVSSNKEGEIYFISLSEDNAETIGKLTVQGEIWSGVSVYADKIFLTTLDGLLYIFDSNISEANDISMGNLLISSKKFPNPINSPLSFHQEKLFFSDVAGKLYAVNINNLEDFSTVDIEKWMISSPFIHNNDIYAFNVAGDFFLIDLKDFEITNKFNTDKVIVGDPKIISYDNNEYIIIPTEKDGIEVISNNSFDFGTSLGSYPTDKKIYSSPMISEENLLIHTQKGEILFFRLKSRDMFYCLNLKERKICD